MKLAVRPNVSAAFCLAIAASSIVAIWYTLLFDGLSLYPTWRSQLQYDFDDEHRWLFTYLAVLPVLGFAIAVAYLRGLSARSRGAAILLVANAALVISGLVTRAVVPAVLFALPMYFGYLCLRGATQPRSPNSPEGQLS